MTTEELSILLTTVGSRDSAESLANQIIELRLGACVQIDGPLSSIYSWQDKVEQSDEYRLVVKTATQRLGALMEFLSSNHPYETPQLISLPVSRVNDGYRDWVFENTLGIQPE